MHSEIITKNMKAEELLEKYPKAGKVVNDWFVDKMLQSLNTSTMTEEFKEYINTHSINNKHITLAIDANPRVLFDVFDDNDVFIEILVDYKLNNTTFTFTVVDEEMYSNPITYTSRKSAEYAAIELAFELLDKKL